MKETLQKVCDAFEIQGQMAAWKKIKSGHISKTYRVHFIREDGRQKSYIVQAINTQVFKNPEQVMGNIDLVTEYIHALDPKRKVLHFHHTAEGTVYWRGAGAFWRLFNYIPSMTYDSTSDLAVVQSAGQAFGEFQTMLSNFDASSAMRPFLPSMIPATAIPSSGKRQPRTPWAEWQRFNRSWTSCTPRRSWPAP